MIIITTNLVAKIYYHGEVNLFFGISLSLGLVRRPSCRISREAINHSPKC